jgi:cobalt-zinc-cadmium efflux system outer membrane protein
VVTARRLVSVGLLVAECASAGEPLTIDRAMALALERSPQRSAAQATLSGAERALRTAGRFPNPLVELRSENWRPDGGSNPKVDYFAVLTMPVQLGGKRSARRDLATANADVAGEGLRVAERQLALDTADRFIAALHARAGVRALTEQRDSIAEVVRILRRRVEEQVAAGADLAKIDAELARLDVERVRGEVELQQALARLAVSIQASPPIAAADLVDPPIASAPPGDPRELAREALDHRPDVAAARARLDAAKRALELERSRAWPDVAVSGGWKRVEDTNTGVMAVVVPLPVTDRNQSEIAIATAEADAAGHALDLVQSEAEADVVASLETATRLVEAAERVQHDLVEPAEVARRAARARLREGGGSLLDLVDAERVAVSARRTLFDLRLDAALAVVRARLALGEQPVP